MISALTLTYAEEAIGIVRAAEAAGIQSVVSFTVETDGRLPRGQPLRAAIEQVDGETGAAAAYFMVSCAHPTHLADALGDRGRWLERLRGFRANASAKSHAELDNSDELGEGDPLELVQGCRDLVARLPNLTVLGGCCGTDHRHMAALCDSTPPSVATQAIKARPADLPGSTIGRGSARQSGSGRMGSYRVRSTGQQSRRPCTRAYGRTNTLSAAVLAGASPIENGAARGDHPAVAAG